MQHLNLAVINAERIRAWQLDQSVDKMDNVEKVDRNFTPTFFCQAGQYQHAGERSNYYYTRFCRHIYLSAEPRVIACNC